VALRSEPVAAAAWLALALLASGSAAGQSRTWSVGPCRLSIPSAWTVTGGKAVGPGGAGEVDEVDNGQASLGMETILPGSRVAHQDGDRTVMENVGPTGVGLVYAVAPVQPDRACRVRFTVDDPVAASAATAAARTLKRR
jgi:hypothetical protein